MKKGSKRLFFFVVQFLLLTILSGCSSPTIIPDVQTPTLAESSPQPVMSATPEPTPTATSAPGLVVVLNPSSDSDPVAQDVLQGWQQAERAAGLRWELRQSLSSMDISTDLRLVIVYPGAISGPELMGLVSAAPGVQFLSVGLADVSPSSNLTTAGPIRADQQGFIAGVVAAMLTPDWRVGVISTSDSVAGLAARNGFLNGATLFCGLCNPYHGPIVDYPLYIELLSSASSAEWQAAAQALLDKAVETVYLAPGVTDPGMLDLLAQNNIQILGSYPMPDGVQARWITSVLPADQELYSLFPGLLDGKSAGQVTLPLEFFDIQESFSPGKEQLARQYLADLMAGYIDTGVDPATGEVR